ncbi:MAG: DUF998 domain-containing protein [Anaerolineales bacterium]|nr:DUF998 domain-containing protein [Anaerolineales bacterium]
MGCLLFIILTLVAMLFYPGPDGRYPGGYSFFRNFFSALGYTHNSAGYPNPVASVMFFIALSLAGAGLVLFFMAFPQFFTTTRRGRLLSWCGTAFGAAAGICFIGIAFTPADVYRQPHLYFVLWAFRLFPIAVFLYAIAIFSQKEYPRRYGWVFVVFGILLVLYVLLLEFGPGYDTPDGLVTQVVGQKIIVYASLVSILIQAWGAKKFNRS